MYEFPDIITNLSSMLEKSCHSFSILKLCKQSFMNKFLPKKNYQVKVAFVWRMVFSTAHARRNYPVCYEQSACDRQARRDSYMFRVSFKVDKAQTKCRKDIWKIIIKKLNLSFKDLKTLKLWRLKRTHSCEGKIQSFT